MPAVSRKSIALMLGLGLALGIAACSERADPVGVSTHPNGYADPTSDVFHGQFVNEAGSKATNCASCHGEDYSGGTAGVSCYDCHVTYPHPDDFRFPSQDNFHGEMVAQVARWDLAVCQSCHGEDYSGKGFDAKDCTTCHTQPDGPEDCRTCHGSLDGNAAPPTDLRDRTSTSVATVGAHQFHVADSTISAIYRNGCDNCHITPETYDAPGHIDEFPPQAEIVWGPLATHDGRVEPVYDFGTNTCSSTYCHGAFIYSLAESENPRGYAESAIIGNHQTMVWTRIRTDPVYCGFCHGLPPAGHIDAEPEDCWLCHGSVVDAELNIIDPSKHVNGLPNAFGR